MNKGNGVLLGGAALKLKASLFGERRAIAPINDVLRDRFLVRIGDGGEA
jgi:hypothetical protein